MTNSEIMKIALEQSAVDCGCKPEDFLRSDHVVTRSRPHPQARKYLPLPFACDLVSYGSNIAPFVICIIDCELPTIEGFRIL